MQKYLLKQIIRKLIKELAQIEEAKAQGLI